MLHVCIMCFHFAFHIFYEGRITVPPLPPPPFPPDRGIDFIDSIHNLTFDTPS